MCACWTVDGLAHPRPPNAPFCPSRHQGCVPGGTSNRAMSGRYLTSHDCARRLRESLREEHILVLDFVSTINKHVSVAEAGQALRGHH